MLATWLHIAAGLSREATGVTLKICKILITMAMNLGAMHTLNSQATFAKERQPPPSPPSLHLPQDVRTAMSALSIDPIIHRAVCCPKCLARYEISNLPELCYYRSTGRSRQCKEPLWTTRTTRKGPVRVPRQLYTTQDIDSWIELLLSRPETEDMIEASWAHKRSTDRMHSILDSPAWKSLGGNFTTTVGNLTFSFYIDWFNPLTNKIAGKSVSCGAIMFFCLNLPYELQHLPEYTFFAGITPPPKEPSVTGINNLLDPIMERFEYLFRVGKSFRTARHPEGRHIRIAVLPAIGDLLAMRKAMGFAGVGSDKNFCSFCKLHKKDIEELDDAKFIPRDGTESKGASQNWHDASTKKEQNNIFREYGVRWTSMHLLSYRDPVKHTVLGMMHNWIEGVLQHHARVFWGIGIASSELDKASQMTNTALPGEGSTSSDTTNSFDMSGLEEELEALQSEARLHSTDDGMNQSSDTLAQANHRRLSHCNDVDMSSGSEDDSDEDSGFEDAEEDREEEEEEVPSPQVFDILEMEALRKGLGDVVIPSYLVRLPSNLGEASHGKLKADQWLVGFTVFFPLILPEIWLETGTKRKFDLLDNFEHLIICTNIISAHSTSNADADLYTKHYIQYRQSICVLFSRSKSRPNHHYAMHNGPLMKFWGPLIKISEYPYETHNGALQRIKTNHHLCEPNFHSIYVSAPNF